MISSKKNLIRLLQALQLSKDELTQSELNSLTWLSDCDWRTIDSMESICKKALKKQAEKKEDQG